MHMKSRMQPARMMRILSDDAGVYEQELILAPSYLKVQKRQPSHGALKTGKTAGKGGSVCARPENRT
jgi:hypothetical protein